MTDKIKMIQSDSEFLEKFSNTITSGDKKWFYMPFWYEKLEDGVYAQYPFSDLPVDLKEAMAVFNIQIDARV